MKDLLKPETVNLSKPLLGEWLKMRWIDVHEGFACRLTDCECAARYWGAPWDCSGLPPDILAGPPPPWGSEPGHPRRNYP